MGRQPIKSATRVFKFLVVFINTSLRDTIKWAAHNLIHRWQSTVFSHFSLPITFHLNASPGRNESLVHQPLINHLNNNPSRFQFVRPTGLPVDLFMQWVPTKSSTPQSYSGIYSGVMVEKQAMKWAESVVILWREKSLSESMSRDGGVRLSILW